MSLIVRRRDEHGVENAWGEAARNRQQITQAEPDNGFSLREETAL